MVEKEDAVGEAAGLRRVVQRDQGGAAAAAAVQDLLEPTPSAGVQGREGLVQDKKRRIGEEGHGEGEALALAAAEGAGPALEERTQAGLVEEADLALERAVQAVEAAPPLQVLETGQFRVDGSVLRDVADLAGAEPVAAGSLDGSGGGSQEAGGEAEEGGLPGPVGPEDGDGLAGSDEDVEADEDALAAIAPVDAVEDQGGGVAGGAHVPSKRLRIKAFSAIWRRLCTAALLMPKLIARSSRVQARGSL